MNNYYEVLGLTPGASQEEIKRAYFRLVRIHTPERDPDAFCKIREAYEHLRNSLDDDAPVFPKLKSTFAQNLLEKIEYWEKSGNTEMFRNSCEQAVYFFPDVAQFRYLLGIAQRQAGNTGKAIKTFEELVDEEPDNKWFARELAISYQERGFTKKAAKAFTEAARLGCRDVDFVLCAARAYEAVSMYDTGLDLLWKMLHEKQRWNRDEMPELLEALTALVNLTDDSIEGDVGECVRFVTETFKHYASYLDDSSEEVLKISSFLLMIWKMYDNDADILELMRVLKQNYHSDTMKRLLPELQKIALRMRIEEDDRLGETIQRGFEAFFLMEESDDAYTYSVLDVKLCMLKEREEILPQLEILEKEYPEYYEKIKSFADRLRSNKSLIHLKDSMQKQYASLYKYFDGGRYFDLYPEEKVRSQGRVLYQDDEKPYTNPYKNVGRNDPCPCGSGKKYKYCCMNKQKQNA